MPAHPGTTPGRAGACFDGGMPAYVIADVRAVRDQDALIEYRRRNTDAVANHGGRFVVRGGAAEVLEGTWDTLRMVVIEFPDTDAARAWWESEEYAPLKQMRRDASDTNILLVEGA
jgi:uncharacterized protein (DUF1330 family)